MRVVPPAIMKHHIAIASVVLCFLLGARGVEVYSQELIPDVERRPYTVTYAPADGSVSRIDPPAFVWLPSDRVGKHIVEYSPDPDFKGRRTVRQSVLRTIHVPAKVLGPGKWFWRYGVEDEASGKTIYSRVRAFTIAGDAARVPFPDVGAMISRLNGVRPRVFVRAEDVARYRRLGEGPLKDHIDQLRKNADDYIGRPLHPEPPFLSKEEVQRKEDFARIMRSTRAFNRGITACATAYLLTGDEKYGQEARRGLLHLAAWDPEGSTSLFHNDEPGHEIVLVMARAYDWIYPLLGEKDKQLIRDVLSVRMRQIFKMLVDKPFEIRPYESHAMDYYIGDLLEASISMAGEFPVTDMLEYVMLQLWSPFFPPYGGDDGGWSEGPSYWQWSTATFLRNFTLVQQNAGVDLTQKPWLQNTPFFKLYANPPYSKMSPFGDSQTSRATASDIMYKLGVALGNPYALWYANHSGGKPTGLERFLYYRESGDEGKAPTDLPQARVFEDIGLAAMHSDLAHGENNVHFLLRSSPFGSISHSYADQNAFALFAYGEPLAIASGYYPYYSSKHHHEWTRQTQASNSVLVNGKGQKVRDWDARGTISDFATTDYVHYAVGDAAGAYKGLLTKFNRHSLFLRPTVAGDEAIIVLFDDMESPEPSSYDWLLHTLEEMQLDEAGGAVTVRRGDARMKVQFLAPQQLRFSQTEQFTAEPEGQNMPNQWHFTARTSSPSSARFVTVLMPYRKGTEASVPEVKLIEKKGWFVVELKSKHTRHVVAFRAGAPADARLQVGDFSTSADVAARAYDSHGVVRARFELPLKKAKQ